MVARILGIGVATLDIINEVAGYPAEDTESRAVSQRYARGGNAANTLTVLSLLGHDCRFRGVLAEDPAGRMVRSDLDAHGVDHRACPIEAGGATPTSCILLNALSGTRTIVHYRRLREYDFGDFVSCPWEAVDWVHFEGRNVLETRRMLDACGETHRNCVISLEVEKPRPDIERLFRGPHWIFFSRVYAQSLGFEDPRAFLNGVRSTCPGTGLICTWGGLGAYALGPAAGECQSPAFPPPKVRDTLGAGDTFAAGVIDAIIAGSPLCDALEAGGRLAGRKCGLRGFEGLAREDSGV